MAPKIVEVRSTKLIKITLVESSIPFQSSYEKVLNWYPHYQKRLLMVSRLCNSSLSHMLGQQLYYILLQ